MICSLMIARGYDYDGTAEYRARYYDPQIGRFISEDPMGFTAGTNFYKYAENDPADLTDASGLSPKPLPPSRTDTVPCDGGEYAQCSQTCASEGKTVESCRVSRTFRVTRWKDGKTLWQWVKGPMSCSCNKPPDNKCEKPLREKAKDWLHDRWLEFSDYMSHPHTQPVPGGPPVLPPVWAPI